MIPSDKDRTDSSTLEDYINKAIFANQRVKPGCPLIVRAAVPGLGIFGKDSAN